MASREAEAARIFLEAVERHEPHQWADYVRQAAAGDAALVQRVQALLRGHGQSNPLLDTQRLLETAPHPLVGVLPGAVIGSYRLLEQIGEGGMGLVYVAEQQQPMRRRVALKIIKPGMDSRQVVARFEAERQALAPSANYSDANFNLQPPVYDLNTGGLAYVTLVVNGVGGTTTIVGHSPALTITSGNVTVNNVIFTTATNAPTILVNGGSLTLRNDVV
jgi:hypothetical protein